MKNQIKQLLETYENEINSFDLHYLLTDDTIEEIGTDAINCVQIATNRFFGALDKVVEELEHYKYLADGIEGVLNYYPDEDFRNKKLNEFYDYMSGDGEYQTGDEDHVISYFYEKWDEEWEQICNERGEENG